MTGFIGNQSVMYCNMKWKINRATLALCKNKKLMWKRDLETNELRGKGFRGSRNKLWELSYEEREFIK